MKFGRCGMAVKVAMVDRIIEVEHQNRLSNCECAAAAVLIRRLLSTDGHGAARFREVINRRWPWLKCQVDRPSWGGAITTAAQHPFSRGPPRKSREGSEIGKKQVPTDDEAPVSQPFISRSKQDFPKDSSSISNRLVSS
eukprot:scaffold238472_cov40-Cyclotella_meneghiniana.AAC.2